MRDAPESEGLRPPREALSFVRFAGLVLDLDARTLTRESGEAIPLTRGEFAILRVFVTRPGRVVNRDTLLDALANRRFEPFDRSVDVLIVRLRRKIEPDPKQPRLIVTVPGEGYRFDGLSDAWQSDRNPSVGVPSLRHDEEHRDRGMRSAAPPERSGELKPGAAEAKPETQATAPDPVKSRASSFRFGFVPLTALAFLVLLVAAGGWLLLGGPSTKPAQAARLSMVVLPFANLSGDPGREYLVDALTDELTTSLARLHDTFVIARNTAMTYKGKPIDAKAIGKDLGVRYVLEGSVQPSGDRMRVNAQLVDAESGAHVWAEQFDTPRADLLQMQDTIVTHLARAMDFQLKLAEAARVKRTPAANRDAEDLGLQCVGGAAKAGWIGKEADAAYALCEQALAIDPNNVRALTVLGLKSFFLAALGGSGDPKGDLARADELASKALALDPDWSVNHDLKGSILRFQARYPEAVAEHERALALNPSNVDAAADLGWDHIFFGHFDKGLEYFDNAIRASPHDPMLAHFYGGKAWANFGLKRYDPAIEWARQAIAINPNYVQYIHTALVAALALTGHDAEAREALQRYLALPSTGPFKTIAAWKAYYSAQGGDPPRVEANERLYEGLRKAGMPEE
jgi:TolB-like protein/DNA-binding winged helix-turn-helix (wHTH) protein/Flp pilus assembly protein TadD